MIPISIYWRKHTQWTSTSMWQIFTLRLLGKLQSKHGISWQNQQFHQKTYNINNKLNCRNFYIYAAICTHCPATYVGQTITSFKDRWNAQRNCWKKNIGKIGIDDRNNQLYDTPFRCVKQMQEHKLSVEGCICWRTWPNNYRQTRNALEGPSGR